MTAIIWDPPPRSRPAKYGKAAGWMRDHPGTWLLVCETGTRGAASARQQSIERGSNAAFRPSRHFQSATRGRQVWARYVGSDGPEAWPADPPPRQPRETTQAEESAA